jgi:hypothetical protein
MTEKVYSGDRNLGDYAEKEMKATGSKRLFVGMSDLLKAEPMDVKPLITNTKSFSSGKDYSKPASSKYTQLTAVKVMDVKPMAELATGEHRAYHDTHVAKQGELKVVGMTESGKVKKYIKHPVLGTNK